MANTIGNGTAGTEFMKSAKWTNLSADEQAFIKALSELSKSSVKKPYVWKAAGGDFSNWADQYEDYARHGNYMMQEQLKSQHPEFYKRYKELFNEPTVQRTSMGEFARNALGASGRGHQQGGRGTGRRGVSRSQIQRYYTGGYGPKTQSQSRTALHINSPSSGSARTANYYATGGYGNNYIVDNRYDSTLSKIESLLSAIVSNTNDLNLLADIKANTAMGGRGTQTIVQSNGQPISRQTNKNATNNIPNSRPMTQGIPASGQMSVNERTARAIAFGS